MAHLTASRLIDLAEGAAPEAFAPHLQTCAACRQQLDALCTTMSAVAEVAAPEPSPLFWDHLSARVHEAVAADQDATSARPGFGPAQGTVTTEITEFTEKARLGGLGVLGGEVRRAAGLKAAAWRAWRPAGVGVLAMLVAFAALVVRVNHRSSGSVPVPSVVAIPEPLDDAPVVDNDSSFALMADLAADLDWESVREAGLTTHTGADDDAVGQLTDGERRELRELLQGELSRSRRGA